MQSSPPTALALLLACCGVTEANYRDQRIASYCAWIHHCDVCEQLGGCPPEIDHPTVAACITALTADEEAFNLEGYAHCTFVQAEAERCVTAAETYAATCDSEDAPEAECVDVWDCG